MSILNWKKCLYCDEMFDIRTDLNICPECRKGGKDDKQE